MPAVVSLNGEQRAAVVYRGGPLCLAAGPGSGKTRVIAARIAARLEEGTDPARLLAITFTNRAAREMEDRVRVYAGTDVRVPIGTFHWAANAILRRHVHRLGVPRDFTLLTPAQSRATIRRVAAEMQLVARVLAAAVSGVKNGQALTAAGEEAQLPESVLQEARLRYDTALRAAGALDLDDLLTLTVQVLTENEDVRLHYAHRLEEILVDEYQDTNPVQREMLRLLLPHSRSLVVVGDEDQAIYGWRHAGGGGMHAFREAFAPVHTVQLRENYRSTKRIVRAANALIEQNTGRLGAPMKTENPAGDLPVLMAADDEVDEAESVAREIARLGTAGVDVAEIAILYRVNFQSRALEDALVRHAIPYQVVAGGSFYERPEVRRVLSYLEGAASGSQAALLRLVAGVPGIGAKRLETIAASGYGGGDVLASALEVQGLPRAGREEVERIRGRLERVRAARERSLAEVVEAAIVAVREELERMAGTDVDVAIENLRELHSIVREIAGPRATLRHFLDRLALGGERDERAAGVRLMTLHAAKGLEFRVVFLTGVEEGLLPHRRSVQAGTIEEERRLCYVGMTRAREMLYLSYTHMRFLGGHAVAGSGSRFLTEIGAARVARRVGPRARRPRLMDVAVGDLVEHSRWGRGEIRLVEGQGRETMVTVQFEQVGMQRIQLCHAPLTRVLRTPSERAAG